MILHAEWKRILADARLPAMLVDLDAFDRNAARLEAASGGKALRLATKSVRVPELISRVLKRGGPWQGLMCFSAEEARFLASQGHDDLLVAYPTCRRSDLEALRSLHDAGKRVSLVVDSSVPLALIAEAMRGVKHPFPLVLELDLGLRIFGIHLGARRSPIRDVRVLRELAGRIHAEHPGSLRVAGCMAYESQVAGLGDRNPFKRMLNPLAALVRRVSMRAIAARRAAVPEVLRGAGVSAPLFNGGGSGSLNWAAGEAALTELSAGSGLFGPHLFDYYSNIAFEPAAWFALQVVRSSDPGFVTCQGGGYIASGEPGWDRVPTAWSPRGLKLVSAEGFGEVQTPLQLPPGVSLVPGDPVIFRHAKAGELAERFNECLLISGGKIVGTAKTYRGCGQSYF